VRVPGGTGASPDFWTNLKSRSRSSGVNRADRHRAEHAPALPHEVGFDRTRVGLAEKAAEPGTQRGRDPPRVDERRRTRSVDRLRRLARRGLEAAGEEVLAAMDALTLARRREREEVGRSSAAVGDHGECARRLPAGDLDGRLAALRSLSLFRSRIAEEVSLRDGRREQRKHGDREREHDERLAAAN
jgi:hypothetical protein